MSKYLYDQSKKYDREGNMLDPSLPEPEFEQKDFTKSAQYLATYLNDLHSVWQPHEGQISVGNALFYEGKTRVFARWGRKGGKQIALDEIIFTPKGFIRYGDLEEGDEVYDEKGKVQKVVGLSEINYSPEAYRVTFCNGESILACAEHRWLTHTKLNRKSERRYSGSQKPTIKTTREIKDSLMHGKEYNHSIPYTEPLEIEERELLIDPYLLGCWLGDGHTHGGKISSKDEEILSAFRDSYGLTHYDKYDYGIIGGFVTRLRDIGVLKNKHIPENYLLNSIDNRLALLQGLMDTDGTVVKGKGRCEFDSTVKELADGVYFLAASLGMKPTIRERENFLYGKKCKNSWRVSFMATMPVFRLKRKLSLMKYTKKTLHHTIVSVEPVESVPMRCISVSGESKLYLIGKSLIPTHNTEFEIYTLYRWAGTIPNGQFYYVAPFYNQAAEIIWHPGRLKYFLGEHASKYIAHIYETDRRIVFHNGSFVKLVGSDNHQAGRGFNPNGAVYDEFKDHDIRFHEGFVDNLIPKKAPLLVVGTPPEIHDHHFVKMEEDFKLDDRGAYFKLPTYVNPYIDKEELERERLSAIRKGEWAKFMREIMAEIVAGGAQSIFPMLDVPMTDAQGKFKSETKHIRKDSFLREKVGQTYKDWDYYMMFDPGSAITMAALFVAIHREFKTVVVLDEIYEKDRMKTSVKQIYPQAQKKMAAITTRRSWRKGYDHAAAWFQVEVQNEFGEALEKCEKDMGEQKKEDKLSVIKDFLLEEMLIISDKCVNFINELATYATNEKGKILKERDHTIDCLRYVFNMAKLKTIPKTRIKFDDLLDSREQNIILDEGFEFEEDIPISMYELEDEFLLGD